jgi:D-alanyl-D-alanine carboxypeptidase/D-alanyl-D-alanine-endopeptidase (penicillin-binding protein 4)
VLAPATPGVQPRAKSVAARVDKVKRAGMTGTFSATVLDGGTGQVLYAKNATKAYIPASTMKILTSTAGLSVLGPQHRFSTRVVTSGKGQITLVGGGDPYLTAARSKTDPDRASLAQLARTTAAQLKKSGATKVKLGYDVSLFSGPSWHPDWPRLYSDQVTPISALWVNEGRVAGASGPRVANPPKSAADYFAGALRARGIQVSTVKKTVAAEDARPVAAVQSLPLHRIVEHLLMVSDNDASEVVARQAAIGAGKPGSFDAARAVMRDRLTKLQVWDKTARIRDGSGLSRKNKVPADMMAKTLRSALSPDHPELRAVLTGLPVAGVEGSLRSRFSAAEATAGRGLVRAKTGTLNQVSALAGYSRTPDGSLLVYAFLVNRATNYSATRDWLDRVTGTISTCGCR